MNGGVPPLIHHPSIFQLDDLVSNKKDLEDVLMFKSTHTLHLDDHSVVEAVSSHKSHKLEVGGGGGAGAGGEIMACMQLYLFPP